MAQTPKPDLNYFEEALTVKIVTPDEAVLDEAVDLAEIPGIEGYIGVMPGHTPFITALKPGVLHLHRDGEIVWQIYVSGGFAEVTFKSCTVLAEHAQDLPTLDKDLAEADIQRLTAELEKDHSEYERGKIQARLIEAQTRLSIARGEFIRAA